MMMMMMIRTSLELTLLKYTEAVSKVNVKFIKHQRVLESHLNMLSMAQREKQILLGLMTTNKLIRVEQRFCFWQEILWILTMDQIKDIVLQEVTRWFRFVFCSSHRCYWPLQRLEFSDQTDELIKRLINIHTILGRTLNERSLQLLCHILTLGSWHLEQKKYC